MHITSTSTATDDRRRIGAHGSRVTDIIVFDKFADELLSQIHSIASQFNEMTATVLAHMVRSIRSCTMPVAKPSMVRCHIGEAGSDGISQGRVAVL